MPPKSKFYLDIPPRELQEVILVKGNSTNASRAPKEAEIEAMLQRQREDYGDNFHNDESDEEESLNLMFQTPATSVAVNSMPITNVANSLFPDMPSMGEDDEEQDEILKKFIKDKIESVKKDLDEKNELAKPLIDYKKSGIITSQNQDTLSRLLMDIEQLEKEIKEMSEALSSKKINNLTIN